jgi:hypothetical protein
MLHPLLTKGANKHYDTKGKVTIQELEKELTVIEMIGYCKGNIFKYNSRKKGSDMEDAIKADKYDNYLTHLQTLPSVFALEKVGISWVAMGLNWSYEV